MIINNLSIQSLRNIGQADISFSPKINLIQGGNGAGKTSLLEAIYLLARSRSFRQTHKNTLIKQSEEHLTVFAEAKTDRGVTKKIGLQKKGTETQIKVNGKRATKLSTLAIALPIALITPHSHRIVEEGPEHRRRLLNWGVFHVKHQYQNQLTKYNRVLMQRNAAIKSGNANPAIWDEQLDFYAKEITDLLEEYVHDWQVAVTALSQDIDLFKGIKLLYKRGWEKKTTFKAALKTKLELDKRRGFTSVGPHRSDLLLQIENNPVKQRLSRGQQKFLVTLLMLAQSRLQQEKNSEKAIILYDDFQSELDRESQKRLFKVIDDSECQTIMTLIESDKEIISRMNSDDSMFHVEHGSFTHQV
ncbi:MAG: DNA replication/repair protein RecF [Candidatus Thiodiazotropha sp. (ex Monitilora ramsayi)]|nr:DNA replication/repair protein RecF [Candidatus Thiodiazotropha sp. (ex Monitilora ramsayi)]